MAYFPFTWKVIQVKLISFAVLWEFNRVWKLREFFSLWKLYFDGDSLIYFQLWFFYEFNYGNRTKFLSSTPEVEFSVIEMKVKLLNSNFKFERESSFQYFRECNFNRSMKGKSFLRRRRETSDKKNISRIS